MGRLMLSAVIFCIFMMIKEGQGNILGKTCLPGKVYMKVSDKMDCTDCDVGQYFDRVQTCCKPCVGQQYTNIGRNIRTSCKDRVIKAAQATASSSPILSAITERDLLTTQSTINGAANYTSATLATLTAMSRQAEKPERDVDADVTKSPKLSYSPVSATIEKNLKRGKPNGQDYKQFIFGAAVVLFCVAYLVYACCRKRSKKK